MKYQSKIVLAQMPNVVGDIEGNAKAIIELTQQAVAEYQADLVVFPELALTGYPPEDLLLRPGFHRRVERAIDTLLSANLPAAILFGHSEKHGDKLYNVASLLEGGKKVHTWVKQKLPNYGVFDEKRYFSTIDHFEGPIYLSNGLKIGCLICEDLWEDEPIQRYFDAELDLLISINASPFDATKSKVREQLLHTRAKASNTAILYVHSVGAQDDLVFDGGSMLVAASGETLLQAPFFQSGLYAVELRAEGRERAKITVNTKGGIAINQLSAIEKLYQALVLGVKDYVDRNGFPGAIVGLSGGIDSALSLAIAVDALGAERVMAVAMPSQHSASVSEELAEKQAKTLGCRYQVLPIEPLYHGFMETLAENFAGTESGLAEQNLQARIRGTLLMSLSNKFGEVVLTTGNKSELAVGYCTLYGDMAGGYAVLKDVFKTTVYELAHYRNTISAEAIPDAVIKRPPTAELAPGQLDQDALPPYETLDNILAAYIEEDLGLEEIAARGFSRDLVADILKRVDNNEYKRRQSPAGVRVSSRAFGRERRYPITSYYRRN